MDRFLYEKEADEAKYIYFCKYRVQDGNAPKMLPHYHDSIEFVFMLRGKNKIRINAEERTAAGGEVTFAHSFEPHFYSPEAGAEYYVVLMSSAYAEGIMDLSVQTFPSFMPAGEMFDKVVSFLDFSFSIWDGAEMSVKAGFVHMFLGIMKAWYPVEPVRRNKTTQTFVDILKYINENYKNDITLQFVSAKFGYAKNYFSKMFNDYTGMNFREYLNRCRINEYWCRKANSNGLPSCRLAELVGFNSLNTFYRALHRYS